MNIYNLLRRSGFSSICYLALLYRAVGYYPEPGNIYYGVVRDPQGRQMTAADGVRLIMQTSRTETVDGVAKVVTYTVAESEVITTPAGQPNFALRVSLDGGGLNRYAAQAVRENELVRVFLVKNGQTNELAGIVPAIGGRGAVQKVDTSVPCVDSDRDGLCDEWEIRYFGTLDATDGTTDFDGDGLTELQEFKGGSSPIDASDPTPQAEPLVLRPQRGPNSSIVVEWRRLPGRSYEIQGTKSLSVPFAPLPSGSVIGDPAAGPVQVKDVDSSVLFLRVIEK